MEKVNNIIRELSWAIFGPGLRWQLLPWYRRWFPVKDYTERKLDVYWLSTGRCGTHFLYNLLSQASNIHAIHDRGIAKREVDRAARIWREDPQRFWSLRLEEFPAMLYKLRENSKFPVEVFTELIHITFPFGYMMYDYYHRAYAGRRRLKLIHLVREPIACCRSSLKVERVKDYSRQPTAIIEGESATEKAASMWILTNRLCKGIVDRIDNPQVAIQLRIEDLDVDKALELCEFMELQGINRTTITSVLENRSQAARFSHVRRWEGRTPPVTDKELEIVSELTRADASIYGY